MFFTPLAMLLEINFPLNFFFVFAAPVIDSFAFFAGQFYEKILRHKNSS